MIEYFLINLIILSMLILMVFLFKIFFVNLFSSKFIILFFMFILMVLLNMFCVVSEGLVNSLICLVFLSFYSMFLMFSSYDQGVSVKVLMLFKIFADYLMFMVLGYFIFFNVNDFNYSNFLEFKSSNLFNMFFIIIFMSYSLLGFFGFWMFWAMEASFFLSSYIHSCGFISLGLVLFFKLNYFGVFDGCFTLIFVVNNISLLSYLFFIYLFLTVKDMKKSFGYFSASSICFLFFCGINYYIMGMVYFFTSSIMKVLLFELMSSSKGSYHNSFFMFLFLFIMNFINLFLFFMYTDISYYNCYMDLFMLLKSFSIFLFLISILFVKFFNIKFTGNYGEVLNLNKILIFLFSMFIVIIYFFKSSIMKAYYMSFVIFGASLLIMFIFNFYFYFFFNTKFTYINEYLNYFFIKIIKNVSNFGNNFINNFFKLDSFYFNFMKKMNIYNFEDLNLIILCIISISFFLILFY